MRLYGYISTKEELFDLMVDEVHAEFLPQEQPDDWREALRILAGRTRQAALRHDRPLFVTNGWPTCSAAARPWDRHVGGTAPKILLAATTKRISTPVSDQAAGATVTSRVRASALGS
jgi:hypothetical protein